MFQVEVEIEPEDVEILPRRANANQNLMLEMAITPSWP